MNQSRARGSRWRQESSAGSCEGMYNEHMRRKLLIWAAIMVVGVLVGAGWMLVQTIWMVEDAERQLHAVDYVGQACETYIEMHQEWPRSWDDLTRVMPRASGVEMPRDLEKVRERVRVNFGAKLEEIARERAEVFEGFAPSGRVYYQYTSDYENVIEAAKTVAAMRHRE